MREKLPLCASKCQIILESGILIKSKCVTQTYCLLQFSLKYLWLLFWFFFLVIILFSNEEVGVQLLEMGERVICSRKE